MKDTPELLPSHVLRQMDVYCWGPFDGRHSAVIDAAGTAIIGPTGSGKTTLIDALMTLLVANPRYNLASTGGHESDRDLVSYVRGVAGAGNDSDDNAHVARPGAAVSAIAAHFGNGSATVSIGAVFWFDGTSSSLSDLKRRWLFCLDDAGGLDTWLEAHREGGARGLKELERQRVGLKVYEAKQAFLSRLRSHFEVGDNAFTLLNRAAGLKQLNSIDEVFRELVLDDRSGFDAARAVADEFDTLVGIRQELETARRQRDALIPVERNWNDHQTLATENESLLDLQRSLPHWYRSRRLLLWEDRLAGLRGQFDQQQLQEQDSANAATAARQEEIALQTQYLGAGGTQIEVLQQRMQAQGDSAAVKREAAQRYALVATSLGLDATIAEASWQANRELLEARHGQENERREALRSTAFEAGSERQAARREQQRIAEELAQARERTSSNVPGAQQMFRAQLAGHLALDESDLPFVAEMLQVKPQHAAWRGAIERALGSERLRLMVPADAFSSALEWVNARDNRLHVRLLESKSPGRQATFFEDGFARMLEFRSGPHREALKELLSGVDRHCVEVVQALRRTPHAMTVEGTMSGREGRFEKQDQRPLGKDWMTGFDNRDRVKQLADALAQAEAVLAVSEDEAGIAERAVADAERGLALIERLRDTRFEDIDHPSAQIELDRLEAQHALLLAPDSEAMQAKELLTQAQSRTTVLVEQHAAVVATVNRLRHDINEAERQRDGIAATPAVPLDSVQQRHAAERFDDPPTDDPHLLAEQERLAARVLAEELKRSTDRLNRLSQALLREIAHAKALDTGALAEAGITIDDVPAYRDRLRRLEEEALPEKLGRFLDYLNQSSDQGVTQLLSDIDIEVTEIETRIAALNQTLQRVDFQPGRFLQLEPQRVEHEALRTLQKARQHLRSAQMKDDQGESHYQALEAVVRLLRDAADRRKTQGALALLDPRHRLRFAVLVLERGTGHVIEKRTSSQGGSGGEKEIIASYVLTASLSYALCPNGLERPLFATIVLDEAFSKSSHAVAGRIVKALHEFGLHPLFVTPNKELRLLRDHTRSAVVVHRRGSQASLTSLEWEALDAHAQARRMRLERSA